MEFELTSEDTDELLRGRQNDEFKALKECFSDQLVDLRKQVKLSKNPKKRKKNKLWIPIELSVKVQTHPEPFARFDMHIKCSRRYPLVPPSIGFKNIKGISRRLIVKLHKQLKLEAANEEHKGQGCIALLIMRAQQFLEDHYRDLELNNKSFYEQMVDQKQSCDREAELNRRQQDEIDKLERERQVEEIRKKILRKRELFNESKKRRDSQSSNIENDAYESPYDYDGDLDGDGTNGSLTDDNETTNRLDDLEEETTIRSRRNTIVKESELKINEGTSIEDSQSRVDREYEVLEELGHGGFGTVYKVRNRVDSRLYALKKVKLNPDNETLNDRIMREVRLLSRLNHENVIRYYTAWNEVEIQSNSFKNITSSTQDDAAVSSKISQESCIMSQRDLSRSSDDEADEVYHTSYLISDKNIEKIDAGETTASYVVFETSDNNDENEIVESMKKALGPQVSDLESDDEDDPECSNMTNRTKINRWLYIQMELGQGTLREAIDKGLPRQKDRARRFFREILDGLCHIHRQGIIHRDLKPVNIFLDSMDRPKIGDFGLATTNLFIVTQNNSPGVHTATAIKPNRMSVERLKMLSTPEQGDSINEGKSGERLRYIHHNHTDNIGTPLYMSPELSATNEKTRIAKVIYSHKVDVYSLGIIYFEMLYQFSTGHERIIKLMNLRKNSISMPNDVNNHLSKEDVELIKSLLTHDVSSRPTSEKLLTSNLLPSIGMKEREYQNIIKQVVQNRQARTHKHMLRLLFDQNDTYVDDFVFDFEDVESSSNFATPNKMDSQNILKDFYTNVFVLDQVKAKMELTLKSRGFTRFSPPLLIPKYTASKYYDRQQLDDVVMLMDKNSSILTLPYDLRLPFARSIARTNINYMNRYAIEKIFRQRQILGYHPDQFLECSVDIVTPPLSSSSTFHSADAEILNLIGDIVKSFPILSNHMKPIIKMNHISLVASIIQMFSVSDSNIDDVLTCLSESLRMSMKKYNHTVSNITTGSLTPSIREDLKRDLMASKLFQNHTHINNLINCLDIVENNPLELLNQYEELIPKNNRVSEHMDEIKKILISLDDTLNYAIGLGLDLQVKISAGFVLNALRPISFYSGMVCMLECKRHSRLKSKANSAKNVILAVGGRYDTLIESFSKNKLYPGDGLRGDTISERVDKENRPKVAVGVSFEVEKFSRFLLEDYVDRINSSDGSTCPTISQLSSLNLSPNNQLQNQFSIRYWPIDIAICSLNSPKFRSNIQAITGLIRQLRDKGIICNEITPQNPHSYTLNSLMVLCMENKIPYIMTIKSQSFDLSQSDDGSIVSISSASPNASPTSRSSSLLSQQACIATLYQLDKSRLKEVKRCDVQTMIDYLVKNSSCK